MLSEPGPGLDSALGLLEVGFSLSLELLEPELKLLNVAPGLLGLFCPALGLLEPGLDSLALLLGVVSSSSRMSSCAA